MIAVRNNDCLQPLIAIFHMQCFRGKKVDSFSSVCHL